MSNNQIKKKHLNGVKRFFKLENIEDKLNWLISRILNNMRNLTTNPKYKLYFNPKKIDIYKGNYKENDDFERMIQILDIQKLDKSIIKKGLYKVWQEAIYDKDFDMRKLRSKVGLVFQYPEHQLFETDIFKDVCFGPKNLGLSQKEVEIRAFESLRLVGIDDNMFYQSPFDLSGGQKRRVAIAGVLAMKPDVLILDEPTAGLDPKGRDDILNCLKYLREETGMTIILVSHSMDDVANYVSRIMVMNDGVLTYDDTPRNVFRHYKELEAIGLAAPQVTYLMNDLKQAGFDVNTDAITIDEAKESILSALG